MFHRPLPVPLEALRRHVGAKAASTHTGAMAGSGRTLLQALEYWGKEQPEKVRSVVRGFRGSEASLSVMTVEIGRAD